jgi:hypothetical protein
VADTGQGFQGVEVCGDVAAVGVDEDLGEIPDVLGFARGESARANNGIDLLDGTQGHVVRVVGEGPESGGHQVDPGIRALGREENGDEQGVRIPVVEWDRGVWVEFGESLPDECGSLSLGHGEGQADFRGPAGTGL